MKPQPRAVPSPFEQLAEVADLTAAQMLGTTPEKLRAARIRRKRWERLSAAIGLIAALVFVGTLAVAVVEGSWKIALLAFLGSIGTVLLLALVGVLFNRDY